jgi:hypothetical protein
LWKGGAWVYIERGKKRGRDKIYMFDFMIVKRFSSLKKGKKEKQNG